MDLITTIQLDPNGFCNAKCWYCPVRYEKLPDYNNMSVEDLTTILDKIVKRKGAEVSTDVFVYTAHYNEILLYSYLKEFLDLLRTRNLKTMILSNGTNLTPDKYELLLLYKDVVVGINLNIPAFDKTKWIHQVGLPENQYDKMIINLDYVYNHSNKIEFSIGMNGINSTFVLGEGGLLGRMSNFPWFVSSTTLHEEYDLFKEKYPNFNIYMNNDVIDRNNLLEKNEVFSLRVGNLLNNKKDNTKIIGCCNGNIGEGRFDNWLHINCKGDVFVCCNDYNYEYIFGNILEQSLEDIWSSERRQVVIQKAKNDMCQTCRSAIWGR